MDKMIESVIAVGVFFILVSGIVLSNYQDAQDATTDADVETFLYLVLILFLIGFAVAQYKKMS